MGVLGVLLSSLIANLVVGSVLAARMLSSIGVRFRLSVAREFLRFGIPLIAMQAATFIVTFGDRYFLNKASSTTEVGLYGLAYQFGFLVVAVGYAPFQRVWDPQRFAVAKRPDRDAVFAQVFVYLNVLLLSAALGISLFAEDVLRLIATPAFHSAAMFVPVLAAAYVLQSWGSFLNLGIFVKERTEYFTLANWVAAAVALAGYVTLIPRWHAWGATVTTLASLAVRCWLSHVLSQRLWRVEYRWGPVVRLATVAGTIGAASTLIPRLPFILSISVHAALFAAYVLLVWWLPILAAEERVAIRRRLAGWRFHSQSA
jgi:O-antigen/teichoic acid export membrane protein